MSEMLGNQYFMARHYAEAEKELEPLLNSDDYSKGIGRKLIICYTQTGKIQKALKLFNKMISEDIEFIMEADPIKDDCPCPELVENIEKIELSNSVDFLVLTGILWLYCDPQKSIACFEQAVKESPDNEEILFALNTINKFFENNSENISH